MSARWLGGMVLCAATCWILVAHRESLGGDSPASPPRFDTEPITAGRLSAAEAAAGFKVPQGFRVQVYAAEPDVRNPIACAWDARGRLWIAENYTYADRAQRFDLNQRDRVVILEDSDGDGRFDKRTIFTDDVQMLTSIEVGRGGVWLMCPPRVLFIPDRNGDDRPDHGPEVVLDGFTVPPENYHNYANGLRWGPDGWLYGRCGASAPGELGVPGTPAARRIPLRGGLWRFHPERGVVEALTHGTTNPWGHDWNGLGEGFFINTVNGHLWHLIAGAHFVRPHTIDPNPRLYQPIDQHADHWHWDHSKDWTDSRNVQGEHDQRGGGHAHCGMLIYLANQWPSEYHDRLMTINLHGRRVNVDRLERQGSGYVGKHSPDILLAKDPWFRGIEMTYGPDGSVYLLDWSDTGECHESTGVHRSSGRIYKVSAGEVTPVRTSDLSITRMDALGLVDLLRHPNAWHARQAQLVLTDRAAQGEDLTAARTALRQLLERERDPALALRGLWTLWAIDGADEPLLRGLLQHEHEALRVWAIRLLTDSWPLDTVMSQRGGPEVAPPSDLIAQFVGMACSDRSALVRLVLSSTLQRLPVAVRASLALALLEHEEDAGDHNLPTMIWTGLIPVAEADPNTLAKLAVGSKIPLVRRWIARRLAEDCNTRPSPLNLLLEQVAEHGDLELEAAVIAGLGDGLTGWRKANQPKAWDRVVKRVSATGDAALIARSRELSVVFGDGRAIEEVRRIALDEKADLASRKAALRALIESRPNDLRAICERLLKVRFLNSAAIQGLSLFDDPKLGKTLVESYRAFHPSERSSLMAVLVSRSSFASALLDQIAAGKLAKSDLSAFHARQIASLRDPKLTQRLGEVWGVVREETASLGERMGRISAWKSKLTPAELARADLSQGQAVFQKTCASCHKLFGQGGEIGPDLTGAARDNLDYLLENLLDPSAAVSADYRMTVVVLKDGRVLNGVIKSRTGQTLTLLTQTDPMTVPLSDIEELRASDQSLMPERLFDPLSEKDVRDLIGFLQAGRPRPASDR